MVRRTTCLILLGFGLVAPAIQAEPASDLSAITVNVNDNASLLVADAQGHLTGVDPTIPKMYQDIPESTGGDVPASHTVSVYHPQGVTYQVFVMGTNIASYKLEMSAYSRDGTPQPKIDLEGDTAPGVKTLYDITYNPNGADGNDPSTMALHQ